MHILSYIFKSLVIRLKMEMIFRGDFFLKILGKAAYVLVYLIFFSVILGEVHEIAGWDRGMIYMLIGTAGIVFRISTALFGSGAGGVADLVRMGGVELFLTKPLPPLLFMLFRSPSISDLLSLPVPVAIVIYGMSLHPIPGVLHIFAYIVSLLLSVTIYCMLHAVLSLLAFKFVRVSAIFWMLSDFTDFSKYPYRIFPEFVRVVFLSILPILAISNLPVLILNGRLELLFLMSLIPIPFAIFLRYAVPKALSAYEGTGTYELVDM